MGLKALAQQGKLISQAGAGAITLPGVKFGLLLNPASGKVKKKIHYVRQALADIPGLIICEASQPTEFVSVIESFQSKQISHLIIIGGDGTVQSVLSYYLNMADEKDLPQILILPGGTTNMTATDLGIKGFNKNLNKLYRLVSEKERWREIRKPLVKLELPDENIIYGFFFGIGVIASGVKFFNQHIKKSGITGEIISTFAIIPFLIKFFLSPNNPDLNQSVQKLDVDGYHRENSKISLFFVTTLERLLFGIKPYWGSGIPPLHVTFIFSYARRFWRSFVKIVFNRGTVLKESDGYFSTNSNVISLTFDGCFIIDGEVFYLENQSCIKLSSSTPITFIVP